MSAVDRPTSWWLSILEKRRERMHDETIDLSKPIEWESLEEQQAAVSFFNAAFRAEESGLRQAHDIAADVEAEDPELARALRLYGDEEGWHRELLTDFLAYIGGEVKPMGPTTRTFYKLYARAERHESIILTNLMFETIGATTYRLALRSAKAHPAIRQMLTILTRDESFHVPLNVHFLRRILSRLPESARPRLQRLYHLLSFSLVASAAASRRRAKAFDRIPFAKLAGAYAEHLGKLFLQAPDLRFEPSPLLLAPFGLRRAELERADLGAIGIEAAAAAADRRNVVVEALS